MDKHLDCVRAVPFCFHPAAVLPEQRPPPRPRSTDQERRASRSAQPPAGKLLSVALPHGRPRARRRRAIRVSDWSSTTLRELVTVDFRRSLRKGGLAGPVLRASGSAYWQFACCGCAFLERPASLHRIRAAGGRAQRVSRAPAAFACGARGGTDLRVEFIGHSSGTPFRGSRFRSAPTADSRLASGHGVRIEPATTRA